MKKFRKLLRKKQWKWTAGGIACLMTAVILFAFAGGVGVRAETIELGTQNVDFNIVNSVYLIESAEQLLKLGNASEAQTSGKEFRLTTDLSVNMQSASTGVFAGTLDGGGYVISYEEINLESTDITGTSASRTEGLLFGSITSSGKVHNLILNVTDSDASYVRNTQNAVKAATADPVYEQAQNPLFTGGTVSGIDDTTKAIADEIVKLPLKDGKRTHTLREEGSQTTTYEAEAAGEDYFGLICGENKGQIDQVYITGEGIAVTRNEVTGLLHNTSVKNGYRDETYSYVQTKETQTGNVYEGTVRADGIVYAGNEEYTKTFADGDLLFTVSAPQNVIGTKIPYTVTVKNVGTDSYTDVSVKLYKSGKWSFIESDVLGISQGSWEIGTLNPQEYDSNKIEYDILGSDKISMDLVLSAKSQSVEYKAALQGFHTNLYQSENKRVSDTTSLNEIGYDISYVTHSMKGDVLSYHIDIKNDNHLNKQYVVKGKVDGDVVFQSEPFILEPEQTKGFDFKYTPANTGIFSMELAADVNNVMTVSGNLVPGLTDKVELDTVNTMVLDGTETSHSYESKGLELHISAPQYAFLEDNTADICYDITVENPSSVDYQDLQLTSDADVKWNSSETGKSHTISTIESTKNGTYTASYSASSDAVLNFSLTGNLTGGTFTKSVVKIHSGAIETAVEAPTNYDDNQLELDNGLTVSIEPNNNQLITGDSITYTLTLTNTNELPEGAVISRDLDITADLSGWTPAAAGDFQVGVNQKIPAGETVTLTKTVTPSLGMNTYEAFAEELLIKSQLLTDYYVFTYEEAVNASYTNFMPDGEPQLNTGAPIISGNWLYAGGFAGKNTGSIQQSKQECSLETGSNDPTEVFLGGFAGNNSGTLQDLYMPVEGSETAVFYGANSGTIQNCITTMEEAKTLSNADTNNAVWASFNKYVQQAGDKYENQVQADLAWLVKKQAFTTGTLNGAEIGLSVSSPVRENSEINYEIAYMARKNMDQNSEDMIHVDSKIQLGKSAFYRVVGGYATDGFYHYENTATDASWRFPYDNDVNPYSDKDQFTGIIERKTDSIEPYDVIMLNIPERSAAYGVQDRIYYTVNIPTTQDQAMLPMTPDSENYHSAQIQTKDGGYQAQLSFDIPEGYYGISMYAGGHIYPMIITNEFGPSARAELTAPQIAVFDYYDFNDKERAYAPLKSDRNYEAGSDMTLTSTGTSASYEPTYAYAFFEANNSNLSSSDWEQIGTDMAVPVYKLKKDAVSDIAYTEVQNDRMQLSADISGEYYLCIKAQSKFHTSVEYCYGPIRILPSGELDGAVYGIEKANIPVGEEATYTMNSSAVVEGDYFYLTKPEDEAGDTALNLESVEYLISERELNEFSELEWLNYRAGDYILLDRTSESVHNLYVYARRYQEAGSNSKYGKIEKWTFQFVDASGEVHATPPTITYESVGNIHMDAASTIQHNGTIELKASGSDTTIFYVALDSANATMKVERVGKLPEMEDGEYPAGYYVEDGRCYYISVDDVPAEVYKEPIVAANTSKTNKPLYISTVAFEKGHNPSEVIHYAFYVGKQQQVASPESALITNRVVDGVETEGERANISRGATLFFTSMTPNAELYYWIGDKAEGEPTLYKDGIRVITSGSNYVITLVAKDSSAEKALLDSEIVTFVYNISAAQHTDVPTATPVTSESAPAVVISGDKILLSSNTTGAVIYYTLNGEEPVLEENLETGEYTLVSGEIYDPSAGITMPDGKTGFFTITAVALKAGLSPSEAVHLTYAFPNAVQAPYADVNSGKVAMDTTVLLKNRTEGANIYYTIGYGNDVPKDPTINSSVFDEDNPFVINQKTTIKAIAVKERVFSEIVTLTYDPYAQLAAPTASIDSGSMVAAGTILTLKAETGTTVHYTTDGSDPAEKGNQAVISGTSIILNGKGGGQMTIKAYASAEGKSDSEVVTFTYLFSENTGGVTADVESGSMVSNGSTVNLMTDVTGAEIYYTINGDSPVDQGKKGTHVTIDGVPGSTVTLKAVAILNGTPGSVVSFNYKIKAVPNKPSASPGGGVLTVATRVTLSSNVEDIYYTTDGSTPTKSSIPYTEPVLINRTTTIKAIAVSEDGEVSEIGTYIYTAAERTAAVTASQEDGEILMPGDEVTLSTTTNGATIYYSTDGTEPTLDNLEDLLVYNGEAIEISRSVTIHAVAYREDMRLSEDRTWSYIVDVIPAVEMKKEEEAKLAEEGLRDTDASALSRNNDPGNGELIKKVYERNSGTAILFPADALPLNVTLITEKTENSALAEKKAKEILGDDQTVLSSYNIKVKDGKSSVSPSETVEIAIPIPKGYEDSVLTVAAVGEGHNLTMLETKREAGILYVKTEKLGSYVVVGPEREAEAIEELPFMKILEAAAGISLVGGLGFYLTVQWKKFKRR